MAGPRGLRPLAVPCSRHSPCGVSFAAPRGDRPWRGGCEGRVSPAPRGWGRAAAREGPRCARLISRDLSGAVSWLGRGAGACGGPGAGLHGIPDSPGDGGVVLSPGERPRCARQTPRDLSAAYPWPGREATAPQRGGYGVHRTPDSPGDRGGALPPGKGRATRDRPPATSARHIHGRAARLPLCGGPGVGVSMGSGLPRAGWGGGLGAPPRETRERGRGGPESSRAKRGLRGGKARSRTEGFS
jgi:hypothetical protein